MLLRTRIFLLFFASSAHVFAQLEDNVFSPDEFLWYVVNYHPVSKQAGLIIESGEAQVLNARGGFDPKAVSTLYQKYYDEKSYYSLLNAGLEIPTWYGIKLSAGYQTNSGDFLNPELNLPPDGLWYGGISFSLGKGLIIDRRRAILQESQILAQSTFFEQQKVLNDLLYDALKAYWKWVESWNNVLVFQESLTLAKERFEAVKQSFFLGDIPAIDTVEANLQIQNLQLRLNDLNLMYQNQTLELSTFLWFENNTPLEISSELNPPNLYNDDPTDDGDFKLNVMDSLDWLENHPDLQIVQLKIDALDINRRMAAESLKPELDIKYSLLSQQTLPENQIGFDLNNYMWGFSFKYPLFIRAERGKLQLSKIKILETEYQGQLKRLEIENKVMSFVNERNNLQQQIELIQDAVDNYLRLLEGERRKFDNGESSLFLINSREFSYISSRLKFVNLLAKYQENRAALFWAMGRLYIPVREVD
jgi:outer membrane protein TolC